MRNVQAMEGYRARVLRRGTNRTDGRKFAHRANHWANRAVLLIAGVAIALCGGCVNDQEACDPVATASALRIRPQLLTRVTSTHFETGDQIGATLYLSSGDAHFDNTCFSYDGSLFTADGATWYTESDAASTLVAYYPYNSAGLPTQFAVQTDQRGDNYEQSDLLAASTTVTPTAEPVPLTFRHLFSQLLIETEVPDELSIEQLTIGGFATTATIHLQRLATTIVSASTAYVTAHETAANAHYCAVFPPQEGTLEVQVQTNEATTTKRVSTVKFEAGKTYTLRITISKKSEVIDAELSGEITDWVPGEELEPDEADSSDDPSTPGGSDHPEESDPAPDQTTGTVEHGGVSYKTQQVAGVAWMAENLRYVPSGASLGKDYYYPNGDSGQAATLGVLYSYATATQAGICPTGWRLPTIAELEALMSAVEKSFFTESGFYATADGATYNNEKGSYLTSSTTAGANADYLFIPKVGETIKRESKATANIAASIRCVKAE